MLCSVPHLSRKQPPQSATTRAQPNKQTIETEIMIFNIQTWIANENSETITFLSKFLYFNCCPNAANDVTFNVRDTNRGTKNSVWNRVLPQILNSTGNEYHIYIIPSTWGGQSAWSREDSIRAFPRIKLRDNLPKS